MKISITGTSRGLGKNIADYLCLSNSVTCYGREYDLRDYSVRRKIIMHDCDVLISVAKPDFVQTELLYEWVEKHGTNKRIINIGSSTVHLDYWGHDIHMMRYHTQKRSLAHAVAQINHSNITIINPEHLYDKDEYDYEKLALWCKDNIKI